MSSDYMILLSSRYAIEVDEQINNILAFWISGSLAREDFIPRISDVDLELIVEKKPKGAVTTDDIVVLREITEQFRKLAIENGATGFHCFVKESIDFQEDLQLLDLALHAKTLIGKKPYEFFNINRMKGEVKKLAQKTISSYSKMGSLVLENKQPTGVEGMEDSVRLVMNTTNTPAPIRAALTVMKAANFALQGNAEWKQPMYIELFKENFPNYRDFAKDLWEYRLNQSKLRERGEDYIREFLEKCVRFTIDVETGGSYR